MPAKTVKMLVTTLVLTAAFGGLLWGTLAEGTEYYMHVDEVMAEPDAWQGKKLQIHGFVVDGSAMNIPNTLEYRFQVEYNGAVIDAEYTGIVPERFGSGHLGPAHRSPRLHRGAQRRDGQVSFEIRAEAHPGLRGVQ